MNLGYSSLFSDKPIYIYICVYIYIIYIYRYNYIYIYIGTLPIVLPFFGLNLGNRLERGYNVNYTDEERITYCAYGEILPSALANVCKRLKEIGIENWRLVKAGKSLQSMLQDWRLNIERLEITFPILHWQSFSRRPLSLNLKNPWKNF